MIHSILIETIKDCLIFMTSGQLTAIVLRAVQKKDPQQLIKVFCVATGSKPDDAVFTRNIQVFQQTPFQG